MIRPASRVAMQGIGRGPGNHPVGSGSREVLISEPPFFHLQRGWEHLSRDCGEAQMRPDMYVSVQWMRGCRNGCLVTRFPQNVEAEPTQWFPSWVPGGIPGATKGTRGWA